MNTQELQLCCAGANTIPQWKGHVYDNTYLAILDTFTIAKQKG